jgi:hypothetical protein
MREPLFVETPAQALAVWASYRREGAEVNGRLGPRTLTNVSPLKGLEIPHAVALFVEETMGFPETESLLRASFGLTNPSRAHREPSLTPEEFESRLAIGLPREFCPPHDELCEAEFEEMARELENRALGGIEMKYRTRYPGLMREGFEQGWKGSESLA